MNIVIGCSASIFITITNVSKHELKLEKRGLYCGAYFRHKARR